jgi:hypothetical protein
VRARLDVDRYRKRVPYRAVTQHCRGPCVRVRIRDLPITPEKVYFAFREKPA